MGPTFEEKRKKRKEGGEKRAERKEGK